MLLVDNCRADSQVGNVQACMGKPGGVELGRGEADGAVKKDCLD